MHVDAEPQTTPVDSVHIEAVVEVFRLLADPTRVRIVLALGDGEKSVNHIAEIAQRPGAAVSQHLAKLRWARLVTVRQEGNRVYYSLTDEHALRVVKEALLQAEHTVDPDPNHHR